MSGGSRKATIGYKYYLGLHFALCYPVDEIQEIVVADRVAWTGNASSGTIAVNSPDLFGGEKKEGGIAGGIDILDGEAAQPVNSYLDAKIAGNIPAFRGVFSLALKQIYIGLNPYLKPWAFKVKRTNKLTNGSAQWYAAKSDISGDLNPVHLVRECLTDSEWGMGWPAANVDDANFQAVADSIHAEGFGLSLLWNQSEAIEDFVQGVMDTIDGKLYVSPSTGLWAIKLIRDDYAPASLPLFDPSNIAGDIKYERVALGETINEISVVYRDKTDSNDKTVTVHDLGNIQMQAAVISQTINYPGISNAGLALRAAQRDLLARSTPISKIQLPVNRQAWDLSIGDVFRLSWPKLGLTEVVYRVGRIGTGELTDGVIDIDAVEDVFALPTNSYAAPQPTGWVDPTSPPSPVAYQHVVEAPYWDVQFSASQADIAQLDSDFGYVLTHASRASGDSYLYELWSKVGGGSYAEESNGSFAPTATVKTAITHTLTTIEYENDLDIDVATINGHAYIGTEMVEVLTIDEVAKEITVNRAILDTVPQAHSIGVRIWFSDNNQGEEGVERVDAEVVDVKLLPSTSQGALAIGSATAMQLTLDNRYQRPYAPGNVKVNAVAYPVAAIATVDVTWAHRDREQQLAYFNKQDEGNIGPEVGTTYSITIRDGANAIIDSATGITATSHSFVPLFSSGTVKIELKAVNGGLDSYQTHLFEFAYSDV